MTDWRTVHVVYYDPDKDGLLLHGIRPLIGRLAGVGSVWFDRHWRRGSQVRVHVAAGDGSFDALVRPAVDDLVGGFLARHPSTYRADPARDLAVHRRLAGLEGEPGPLLPWYPDNSVPVTSRRPPDGAVGALLADFHRSTNELVFDIIAAVRGPARRAACFDLMIATAHALSGTHVTRSFLSFRSHAEAFLCGYPEGPALRPVWQRHAERGVRPLAARVGAVVDALDGARPAPALLTAWVGALRPFRQRAAALIGDGAGAMPDGGPAERELAGVSDFHRRLFAHPGWADTRTSTDFQAYRLMLNLTYLTLTRIGVTPVERFLLCHLAADAVEARYGVSAFDLAGPRGPLTGTDAAPG